MATVLGREALQEIHNVYQLLQKEQPKKSSTMPISPQRIANHFLLLDRQTLEPRFSPSQIEAALQTPISTTAAYRGEVGKSAKEIIEVASVWAPTPVANDTTKAEINATPRLSSAFLVSIEDSPDGEYQINVPITNDSSVCQILQYVQRYCGQGKLMYRDPSHPARLLVTEDQTLQNFLVPQREWFFRVNTNMRGDSSGASQPGVRASGVTTFQSAQVESPRRQLFPRAEDPPSDTPTRDKLTQAAKLQTYELTLQKSIREVVHRTIPDKGFGTQHQSAAATVCAAVHVVTKLNAKWLELEQDAQERGDGVPLRKRLQWFLAAILDQMDPALSRKWIIQSPAARREVNYYADWSTFQRTLGELLATEVHVCPEDLLSDLDAMMGPIAGQPNVATFLATLQEFRVAGHEFVRLRQSMATDREVDRHVGEYLLNRLTDTARTALSDMLALQPAWRSTVPAFFTEKYPPLEAYPLDTLLQAVQERGLHRQGLAWTQDFHTQPKSSGGWGRNSTTGQGNNRQRLQNSSGKSGSSGASSGAGINPTSGPDTGRQSGRQSGQNAGTFTSSATVTQPPHDVRTLKVDGQRQDFPYHLRSIQDALERDRSSQLFVELTVRDVVCRSCQQPGHTSHICPKYFQLDAHSVEQNPRSFFYLLRPPQRVLNLRAKSVMAVQTGPAALPDDPPAWAARLLRALEQMPPPAPSVPTATSSMARTTADIDSRAGPPTVSTIPRYDFTGLGFPSRDVSAHLNGPAGVQSQVD